MKKFAPIFIASFVSAILAILGYRVLVKPQEVPVRQIVPASFMSDTQEYRQSEVLPPLSGPSSLKSDGFVHAAYAGTQAVVAIQSVSGGSYWRELRGSSSGSGVIIDPDGYIATNNHVVTEGDQVRVTLNDQREFLAKIVGKDPTTDLALLKIDATNLPYLKFGNSDSVFLGEWVLAVGNPFRLQSTVTAGIVSAKGRNIQILSDATGIESFIQTDAAVNPGNSGGALLNARGELIGINTAIITYSGQYEGFSFAIPGNLARKVLNDLRKYGSAQRGWLGVTIRPVDYNIADRLGLKKVAGVYLESVIEGSAAAVAGLQAGDVILSVNDIQLNSTPEFMEQVGRRRPGDRITVQYFRNGDNRHADVILSEERFSATTHIPKPEDVLAQIGMSARNLTDTESSRLRTKGVYVEKIVKGSIADQVNMEPEYIITSVNHKPVSDVVDLVDAIHKTDDQVLLEGFYERSPRTFSYQFRKD